MDLHEVIIKLVGPIGPIGESREDAIRYENMKVLTDLVDKLLGDISRVESSADRVEASMKKIGQHARAFLRDIREV